MNISRLFHCAAAGALPSFFATHAVAGGTWNGAPEGDWFVASNWTLSGVPTSSTEVEIINNSSALIAGPGALSRAVSVGSDSGNGELHLLGNPGNLAGRPTLTSSGPCPLVSMANKAQ